MYYEQEHAEACTTNVRSSAFRLPLANNVYEKRIPRRNAREGNAMYDWRKMTASQREEALRLRKARGYPKHSPPHFDTTGETTYLVSAACFEHAPIIGFSPERMAQCEEALLAACVVDQFTHMFCSPDHSPLDYRLASAPRGERLFSES